MRCGFETEIDAAQAWQHSAYKGPTPTTCVGYSRQLPDVVEITRARVHWEHGQLEAFCDGETPHEIVLALIELLDGSAHQVEAWLMTPADKGGGAG